MEHVTSEQTCGFEAENAAAEPMIRAKH